MRWPGAFALRAPLYPASDERLDDLGARVLKVADASRSAFPLNHSDTLLLGDTRQLAIGSKPSSLKCIKS
jgi:hypothetical protein